MTKQLSLTILLTLIHLVVAGQDYKFLLGGTLGTSIDNEEAIESDIIDSKQSNFNFSGLFGYYLTNRIILGTEISHEITKTNKKGVNPSETKSLDYIVSPFLRYYFNQAFVQAQGNVGKSKYTHNGDLYFLDDYYDMDIENNHNIFGWGIGIGYDFKLSTRLLLEPIVKYNSNKHTDKVSDFDLKRNGLSLHIGLAFKL
ncbi:autotransporter domain-containing protein [Carboxylicivirga sp. RSCT41]|uniref:autotransporter domain-containing protein n=1 Tax=Carboxylicivirga agarovorans TaxID=3417570 RepID=UPI003D340405